MPDWYEQCNGKFFFNPEVNDFEDVWQLAGKLTHAHTRTCTNTRPHTEFRDNYVKNTPKDPPKQQPKPKAAASSSSSAVPADAEPQTEAETEAKTEGANTAENEGQQRENVHAAPDSELVKEAGLQDLPPGVLRVGRGGQLYSWVMGM